MKETQVQFLGQEDPLEKGQATHSSTLGLPLCGSAGKDSTCNAGDLDLIPGLGRCPGEGKGYPIQYSGLENSTECIEDKTPCSQCGRPRFDPQSQVALVVNNLPANAGDARDTDSMSVLGRYPGIRNGTPIFLLGKFNGQSSMVGQSIGPKIRHD